MNRDFPKFRKQRVYPGKEKNQGNLYIFGASVTCLSTGEILKRNSGKA